MSEDGIGWDSKKEKKAKKKRSLIDTPYPINITYSTMSPSYS
jgi:hypothetical protein